MRTYMPKADDVTREWHVVDAEGRALGRLATEVAGLLRGKHKPQFSLHVDTGDYVIVVNAAKLAVSPDKAAQKRYFRHSGYPGGLRETTLSREFDARPEEVVRRAVRGMLPKNRLGRKALRKLKVYAGPEHPHEAQLRGTPGEPNSAKARKRPAGKKAEAPPEAGVETPEAEPVETVDEAPDEVTPEATEAAAEVQGDDAAASADEPGDVTEGDAAEAAGDTGDVPDDDGEQE